MPTPAINYDNSKRWYISVRPRDAVAIVILGAVLNGFFSALFTYGFEQVKAKAAHPSPTDSR